MKVKSNKKNEEVARLRFVERKTIINKNIWDIARKRLIRQRNELRKKLIYRRAEKLFRTNCWESKTCRHCGGELQREEATDTTAYCRSCEIINYSPHHSDLRALEPEWPCLEEWQK